MANQACCYALPSIQPRPCSACHCVQPPVRTERSVFTRMRRQDEDFAAEELVLVYIAKRLKEALRLEEAFTAAELDYLVEPDKYQGGVLFRSERVGAFFYVQVFDVPRAQELLRTLGHQPYKPQESG